MCIQGVTKDNQLYDDRTKTCSEIEQAAVSDSALATTPSKRSRGEREWSRGEEGRTGKLTR